MHIIPIFEVLLSKLIHSGFPKQSQTQIGIPLGMIFDIKSDFFDFMMFSLSIRL